MKKFLRFVISCMVMVCMPMFTLHAEIIKEELDDGTIVLTNMNSVEPSLPDKQEVQVKGNETGRTNLDLLPSDILDLLEKGGFIVKENYNVYDIKIQYAQKLELEGRLELAFFRYKYVGDWENMKRITEKLITQLETKLSGLDKEYEEYDDILSDLRYYYEEIGEYESMDRIYLLLIESNKREYEKTKDASLLNRIAIFYQYLRDHQMYVKYFKMYGEAIKNEYKEGYIYK